jgi:hypothetical protein
VHEPRVDEELRRHIVDATAMSPRQGLADKTVRFGRQLGWYALVRTLRSRHVVETGTDKGQSSCLLASALLRNGSGRLTTIDVNPETGYLISGAYADVTTRLIGNSLDLLPELEPVDLLVHDSLHTFEHETAEFEVTPLAQGAVVLSDNAHGTDALARWAERTGRRFLFFAEDPRDHWYPGAGIGAAWT